MSAASATHVATPFAKSHSLSDIKLIRDYPHAPKKVWRALTDPALMALWGMRPEGFATVAGTRFKLIGKPSLGWRGFVECEVREAREPSVLRYSWIGNADQAPTESSYTLTPYAGGTRLGLEHIGFKGIGGFLLAKLIMMPGLKDLLDKRLPAVLADVDDAGTLRQGSHLRLMI